MAEFDCVLIDPEEEQVRLALRLAAKLVAMLNWPPVRLGDALDECAAVPEGHRHWAAADVNAAHDNRAVALA
jgi:hypothetical protein